MVRHDARVSVRQAFTKPEVLQLRERAGVGFAQYFRHFGHRFVLAPAMDRVEHRRAGRHIDGGGIDEDAH